MAIAAIHTTSGVDLLKIPAANAIFDNSPSSFAGHAGSESLHVLETEDDEEELEDEDLDEEQEYEDEDEYDDEEDDEYDNDEDDEDEDDDEEDDSA